MSTSGASLRAGQLRALDTSLRALTRLKRGLALVVWGDPGIGKSWLLAKLLMDLPYRSVSVAASTPGGAFVAALPAARKVPPWAGTVLRRAAAGEPTPEQDLIRALAVHLSAVAPLVVHVEDLHDAGPARLAFWGALAQACVKCPGVAMVATSRVPLAQPWESFPLGSLSEQEVRVLLEAEVAAALPASAFAWIHERARGNPLFSLEYLRYLARQGNLWNDGTAWRWRIPDRRAVPVTVEALIHQQLQSSMTSAQVEAVLAARAMDDGTSDAATLAEVAEVAPAELERIENDLRRRAILRQGEFVHPLYREVFLSALGERQRQRLARRFITVHRLSCPERAAHYVEDANLEEEESLDILSAAADASRSRGDALRTARTLSAMCGHTDGARRSQLALQAAEMLHEYDLPAAVELARLSVYLQPQHPDAVFLLARLLARQGRGREAADLIRGLPEDRRPQRAWLRERIALQVQRHDYAGAAQVWCDHLELHDEPEPSLLVDVAYAHLRLGRMDEVLPFLEEARSMPDRSASGPGELAMVEALYHFYKGDYLQSEEVSTRAIDRFDAIAMQRAVGGYANSVREKLLNNRAIARYKLGRYQEAIDDAEKGLALAAEVGDGRRYSELQANLGCSLIELGCYERAEELLTEGCAVLEHFDLSVVLTAAQGNLAYLYLEWRPPHGGPLALKYAHTALENARKLSASAYVVQELFFAGWAEVQHGSPAAAHDLIDELLALATGLGQEHFIAMGHWLRGLALERQGRAQEAERELSVSVAEMQRLGLESSAERMALELDRLTGDRVSAARRTVGFRERDARNAINIAERYFPVPAAAGREGPSPAAPPALRLEVLGTLKITRAGAPLPFRAQRGKELLAYLLEARAAGRAEVPQHELRAELYPNMVEAQGSSALQQLVYRVRTALGSEAVLRTGEGYMLGPVSSDLEEFLEQGTTRLWRGPYLQGVGDGWDANVSDALHEALRSRVAEMIDSEPSEAARLCQFLLQSEPYDIEVLELTLHALESSKRRRTLEKVYSDAVIRWAEVGEELPDSWQAFVADRDPEARASA